MASLEKTMSLESFSGRGYTLVFDESGNYIIKKDADSGLAKRQNFYENLIHDYDYTDEHINEIKAEVAKREHFNREFIDNNDEDLLIHFDAIANTDWTMMLVVPKAVINSGAQTLLNQTGILLGIIIVILVFVALIIIALSSTALDERAKANARAEFLASMSHEIRTPLNSIIGLNHLMQENLDNKPALRDYLHKSAHTEKYLLSLINDILDVQKIQTGKMDLFEEPFSVSMLIINLESIMRSQMESKDISFTIEKDIACDTLIGDVTRTQQILMNILGNSVKFTDREGHVNFKITQGDKKENKITTIYEISDDGCGMSDEFKKKIFDPFEQEKNKATEAKGTGLGMSISHMLAEQMGGSLTVESELGKGSTFKLVMTNTISEMTLEEEILHEISQSEVSKNQLNILLAEDNELNADILIELLEAEGHTVKLARDGEEVVDLFMESEEFYYNVILMDVQMPKRNGYEATRIIRGLGREDAESIVIFACTANTFWEDVEMAEEAGMNDFIAKPIDIDKMVSKLNTVMLTRALE